MNTNLPPQPKTDLSTTLESQPTQASLPVWRAPAIIRIEIKRTMYVTGSIVDGYTGSLEG